MSKYLVGYYNLANKNDFVILVSTTSRNVAEFVKISYNEAYIKAGMSMKVDILEENDLPTKYRFVDDL